MNLITITTIHYSPKQKRIITLSRTHHRGEMLMKKSTHMLKSLKIIICIYLPIRILLKKGGRKTRFMFLRMVLRHKMLRKYWTDNSEEELECFNLGKRLCIRLSHPKSTHFCRRIFDSNQYQCADSFPFKTIVM